MQPVFHCIRRETFHSKARRSVSATCRIHSPPPIIPRPRTSRKDRRIRRASLIPRHVLHDAHNILPGDLPKARIDYEAGEKALGSAERARDMSRFLFLGKTLTIVAISTILYLKVDSFASYCLVHHSMRFASVPELCKNDPDSASVVLASNASCSSTDCSIVSKPRNLGFCPLT